MALKQRYQNPVVDDTVRLKMITYNSNNLNNVFSIEKVDIYLLDPYGITEDNPEGRVLIETVSSDSIVNEDTGKYYFDLEVSKPRYVVGKYLDIWSIQVEDEQDYIPFENNFELYRKLWYATTTPIVYDFSFNFAPNRVRKGSKKPIRIQIIPEVPKATDLEVYYTNLAIYSDLKINIAKTNSGECDGNYIAESQLVEDREKVYGFYYLDTTELDCGLYDVWFELDFGNNVYISDKNQLLIY